MIIMIFMMKKIFVNFRLYKRISLLSRELKFFKQKITRGFSDKQLWNLDVTLAKFLLPRFKRYLKITKNVFEVNEQTTKEFEEILWMLETVSTKKYWSCTIEETTRVQKACELLGKNLLSLWY